MVDLKNLNLEVGYILFLSLNVLKYQFATQYLTFLVYQKKKNGETTINKL